MLVFGRVALMGNWDTNPVPDGCVAVRLVPSYAEGYGWDTTTQAVLLSLQANLRPGTKVMDFGAGTGVLALAALALGAKQADAVEWQETSRDIADKNAKASRVSGMSVHKTAPAKKYGLIMCNLFGGDATVDILPILSSRLSTTGKIIVTCQGSHWDAAVTAASELGLDLESYEAKDDVRNGQWFIGVFTWHR